MSLFKISQKYMDFCNALESGEVPEEAVKDTLDAIQGEFSDKADNIVRQIKTWQYEAKAIAEEVEAMEERARAKRNSAESLKRYLMQAMQSMEMKKIDTLHGAVSVRKNPPSLVVDDEKAFINWAETFDNSLINYATPTLNKKAIVDQIKAGLAIPSCHLEQGMGLQLR